jgi:hypothetical protein
MYDTVNFFELKGQTIIDIVVGDATYITTNTGKYQIYHLQDCCESVSHYKTIGNVEDIIDSPITLAEDDYGDPDWYDGTYYDSHTWTSFFLETVKGRVELWFLGESNGYYSETMRIEKDI